MGGKLHGDWHNTGTGRWCAYCRKWCNVMDWETEHIEHGNYRVMSESVKVPKKAYNEAKEEATERGISMGAVIEMWREKARGNDD